MCYSAEIQLITSILIFSSSLIYYIFFHKKFAHLKEDWENEFLKYLILAFVSIGGHQFFEFLSLVTSNQWIYKIGLLISLSSMYFFLRSLEVLMKRKIHSWLALIVIGLTAIHLLISPLVFESFSFFLYHKSTFIWASAWFLLFIYWNIHAITFCFGIKDKQSRHEVILYLLFSLDVSFLLSAAYTLYGYAHFNLNVCAGAPSIWCTFFVVQVLFIPLLLAHLHDRFKRPRRQRNESFQTMLLYLSVAIIIFALALMIIPFFKCLTWKFVFP